MATRETSPPSAAKPKIREFRPTDIPPDIQQLLRPPEFFTPTPPTPTPEEQLLLRQERERREQLQREARRQQQRLSFEEKYQQALLRGRRRCSYGRVMFLGAAAVGKTSLRHGLMNKRLPRKAESTILVETHRVKYSWAMTGNPIDHNWAEMSEDDEVAEEVRMIENTRISTVMTLTDDRTPVSQTKLAEVAEHKEKVLQHAATDELCQSKADDEVLLHLWDCGGQPVFLDVLPAFLSSRTMFVLVFNASKGLTAPFKVYAFDDGLRKYQGLSITTLSLFHKWMAAIHARFGGGQEQRKLPSYPRILLVGTHADQLQLGSGTHHSKKIRIKRIVSRMCDMFYESIKGKEYADMVIGILVVDNTTAGKSNADPGFQEIQKTVYSFVRDKLTVETPLNWIHFRKVLQLRTRKLKKVISIDEVYSIAKECHVPRNDVVSALLFYHDLGVFLFYPRVKGLKSVVILEPQWLVDQFGNLFASWKGKTEYSDMWNTLTKYGILVEPLYEAVLESVSEQKLTPSAMIEMLENFLLAAPIVTTDRLHTRSGKVKEYFVPHMLQRHLLSKSCVAQAQSSSLKNAAPFHLTFLSGYVPPGFYVRLVTSLASKKDIVTVLFHSGIYRDQITMRIGEVDRLTITEHTETIELQYSRRTIISEPFRESCRRLLELLDECLSDVYKWLPGATPQLAFLCLDCAREAQPDILSRAKFCPFSLDLPSTSQHLHCDVGHTSLPTHDQQYWLHYKMGAIEHDQAQYEKRLQLTKSTFPDAALDLADRLELNPLTAVIHQYRRIGGDETMLVRALSDMNLTTQLDAAGQSVLDDDESSSAAPQISSCQNPVHDSSVSAAQQQEAAVLDVDESSSAALQTSPGRNSDLLICKILHIKTAVHSKCDRHTQTVSSTLSTPAHTSADSDSQASSSQIPVQDTTVLSFSKSTKRVSSTLEVSLTPPQTITDSTDPTDIVSPMHSALNMPPNMRDLMNKVAARTRNKWTLVAVQLDITSDRICSIQSAKQSNPMLCYLDVFTAWENKGSPPYTWATIIKALRAPSVEKDQLAKELEEWLLSK